MASPKAIASASSSPVAAGAFTDANNNPVTSGYLICTLNVTAAELTGGGQISAKPPIKITLDANGKPSAGQTIFANDQVNSPSGTSYLIDVYTANDNKVASLGNVVIAGAAPIDLTTLTPTSTGASYPGAVLLQPTGQQTINGQDLVMEGAAVGFSSASSTTADVFLSRAALNVAQIGTTDSNASGTLKAATILLANGSAGAPAYSFSANTNQGLFSANNLPSVAAGGFGMLAWDTTGMRARQNAVYGWASGAGEPVNATNDTGLSRTAAATVAMGNGTQGDTSGTLKVASVAGASLYSAGAGNTVTLLNAQGPVAALTGNSADQTIYTYTIPANTIGAGKGIRVKVGYQHTSGTASTTYKLTIGSTTPFPRASADTGAGVEFVDFINSSGVQNSQFFIYQDAIAGSENTTFGTASENFANAVTVKFTFNVANTDQVTGKLFLVEILQ